MECSLKINKKTYAERIQKQQQLYRQHEPAPKQDFVINTHFTNCPLIGKQLNNLIVDANCGIVYLSLNGSYPALQTVSYNILHPHLFCFRPFDSFFPLSEGGAWTKTCMVVTPPGTSHNGLLHSPKVLLFSRIFPALIIFTSFTVLGPFSLSLGHWERMLSFKVATLAAAGKLLGPMSDPSVNLNLISNWSCASAILQILTNSQYPNTTIFTWDLSERINLQYLNNRLGCKIKNLRA